MHAILLCFLHCSWFFRKDLLTTIYSFNEPDIRAGFVRKVYSILTVQLVLTAVIAFPISQNYEWAQKNRPLCQLAMIPLGWKIILTPTDFHKNIYISLGFQEPWNFRSRYCGCTVHVRHALFDTHFASTRRAHHLTGCIVIK